MKAKSAIYFYILISLLLTNCHGKKAQIHELERENDSLRKKVALLELQNETIKDSSDVTQVLIANTDVEFLSSKFNKQEYQLKISYPKSYFNKKEKAYPVLYILDAETNFGGVSYIVQRLIKDELIPEVLVVGIAYNTDYRTFYQLRSRDLTPVEDKELRMGNKQVDPTGGAPAFSDFLEFELFPFIEKNYRIKKEDRAIYGHSYGGLYGSYALLDKPHLFNRYVLLGPSLWYKDKFLVNQVASNPVHIGRSTKLYMASGELDLRIQEYQVEFVEFLQEKNIPNLTIKSEIMENETHRTIFGSGFTNGLRFIYEE